MEDGFRYALDTVASAFLPESEFGRDGAEPPKEPWQMLRKHFESNYMQHSVLRPEANPGEVEHGIRQNGFSQGIGPNVVRPTSGNPTDIMQRNYGTKAGVPVIAVPSMHTQQGGNGARIKDGWKLEGGHIGVPERDYEPLHRVVVRTALAAGKPVPPEVLAEHPDLVNTKATKPPAQEFARKPAKGQKGFDFDEGSHPRESSPHDGKRPGEFAPKDSKALAVGSGSGPSATLNLKPNMVYGDARDQAGRSIGFVTHPHDGTPDGMRASHANLKSQMNEYDPEDWSNIQTRWGATDESGQPAFVISPNGKHIATAKSPAARYILGDVHSDSKDGLVVNSPGDPEVWHQGDRVRMTGKTSKIAGGTFHEAEILEGHKKGQMVQIRDKGEKDAEAAGKQQEWKDQQSQFRSLNRSPSGKSLHFLKHLGAMNGGASADSLQRSLRDYAADPLASNRSSYHAVNIPMDELIRDGYVERGGMTQVPMAGIGSSYAGPGSASPTKVESGDSRRQQYSLTPKGWEAIGMQKRDKKETPDEDYKPDPNAISDARSVLAKAEERVKSTEGRPVLNKKAKADLKRARDGLKWAESRVKEFSRPDGACRSMLVAAIHKALDHDGKYTKDPAVDEIPENPSDLDEHTAAVLAAISEHSQEVKTALAEYLAS